MGGERRLLEWQGRASPRRCSARPAADREHASLPRRAETRRHHEAAEIPWENNREFFDFGPFFRAIVLKIKWNSGGYERIPYAMEQGNNSSDLGMFSREQGIIVVKGRVGQNIAGVV